MIEIPLAGSKANGRVALIDDEDFAIVSQRSWVLCERRHPNGRIDGPYARASTTHRGKRITIWMHKLITGYPMTDHANGNGLDNRRGNLRPATHSQNSENRQPSVGASSRYLGVTWHRGVRKWQAAITHAGKPHYLGVFLVEEQAAVARDAAALTLHGEFARLNFPADVPGRGDA